MIQRIRCTIYTRKSSEEGLEQSFNSLDAQREACEAYILSQKHEGWQMISMHYDDGGFSGGNTERPALKRLMVDIHAGKVNTVVVYKVDRLTRSLADFAKIIEQFDEMRVSFVSVTQQFNTTTSMGRLTLNVLLSFAQFEREVTGERIRDKIAASKRKGMWMGGTVPLGYDVRDRKLYVNESDAERVRLIFSQFLHLGTVTTLKEWLRENDIRSKKGNHYDRGALYRILHNPLYIGLIRHKKDTYPGEHPSILDRDIWGKVQALLTENQQGKHRKPRSTKASLLTGILYDEHGTRYTPTHASKQGRRYRYYTSQVVIHKTEKIEIPVRIPAPDLEAAVTDRILDLLRTPEDLLAALTDDGAEDQTAIYSAVLAQAATAAATWTSRSTVEKEQFLKAILDRVIIHPKCIEIRLRIQQLIQQLAGDVTADSNVEIHATAHLPQIASIECAFRHVSQGKSIRLIVGNSQITTEASRLAILKAIARARLWYEQLIEGVAPSVSHLARMHHVSPRYVNKIIQLAQLSPQSIEAILTRPESLPLSLDDLLQNIPMNWKQQSTSRASQQA
jgi:site-specific DNA recombinase